MAFSRKLSAPARHRERSIDNGALPPRRIQANFPHLNTSPERKRRAQWTRRLRSGLVLKPSLEL
jgi:hypothetical protein